jgi:hypothetical protein
MAPEHEIVPCARVAASVETGFDEQIDYTKELVQFASVRGTTTAAASRGKYPAILRTKSRRFAPLCFGREAEPA